MGETDRGKLGPVLMGRAMLSKSLIQFSVVGWGCVASPLFTWGQTMVEVMKIMATSFKRSHVCTAVLSGPNPAAGHHQPMPPQETDPDLPMSVQWRCGLAVAYCRVWGTTCNSACMGPFEGGHHYLHLIHYSSASGQTTGMEHSPAISRIKNLLSTAPPIRTRPSFPLSQSLPSVSFHKPLNLLHQRADKLKTTITEN